jgi:hypothetical protein
MTGNFLFHWVLLLPSVKLGTTKWLNEVVMGSILALTRRKLSQLYVWTINKEGRESSEVCLKLQSQHAYERFKQNHGKVIIARDLANIWTNISNMQVRLCVTKELTYLMNKEDGMDAKIIRARIKHSFVRWKLKTGQSWHKRQTRSRYEKEWNQCHANGTVIM